MARIARDDAQAADGALAGLCGHRALVGDVVRSSDLHRRERNWAFSRILCSRAWSSATLDETTVIRIMVWSLALYMIVGLLGGAMALDVAWLAPSAEESVYRLQGFSGHPNTFGQQAAIFITLTAIAYRLRILGKPAAGALLLVGLIAILASGSRTNLAAAAVAWMVIAIRSSHWRHLILLTGMTLLATLLMVAATGGLSEIDGLMRGLSRTGSEGEIFTLTGRTELWATCWKLITEQPLLGWGYNGIEEILASSVSPGFEGTPVNAHNMLMQSLVSLGFLGSLACDLGDVPAMSQVLHPAGPRARSDRGPSFHHRIW